MFHSFSVLSSYEKVLNYKWISQVNSIGLSHSGFFNIVPEHNSIWKIAWVVLYHLTSIFWSYSCCAVWDSDLYFAFSKVYNLWNDKEFFSVNEPSLSYDLKERIRF